MGLQEKKKVCLVACKSIKMRSSIIKAKTCESILWFIHILSLYFSF